MTSSKGQPFVRYPAGFSPLASAEIEATVSLVGAGRAGVMGRHSLTPQGQESMYAFWIANDRTFGLTKWQQGASTEMLPLQLTSDLIRPVGENELALRTQGQELSLWINGRDVFDKSDPSPLPAGTWGLYTISDVGSSMSGRFSQVTIYGRNI
jgi:hypothetical protein